MRGPLAAVAAIFFGIGVAAGEGPAGEILFYEETARGHGDLVVLDLVTGSKRKVGQSGSRSDHVPSWSPDGRNIVFESYRKGGWHVWTADATGNHARRLSDLPDYSTGSYEFDPVFAPDNRTVAFVHADRLWTVTLDEPTPRRMSSRDHGIFETAPAYSPSGELIAIAGRDDRSRSRTRTRTWNIYTLKPDGSGFRQLTDEGRNLAPQWSPDGRRILFYSDRDGSLELYEMTPEGANITPILDRAQRESAGFEDTPFIDPWDGDWGATEQYRASYSPDGGWIVFSREIEDDRELFVSRRDGSEIIRVTHRAGLDAQPAWRSHQQP